MNNMLLVSTYVARSKIHGWGLFANEDIQSGQIVWAFDPNFDIEIPADLLKCFLECDQNFVKTHAEYMAKRNTYILGNDGDIYMNHSDNPNLIDKENYMIAGENISKGDEITCDYRTVKVLNFVPNEA